MKKLLSLILVVLLSFGLVSCTIPENPNDTAGNTDSSDDNNSGENLENSENNNVTDDSNDTESDSTEDEKDPSNSTEDENNPSDSTENEKEDTDNKTDSTNKYNRYVISEIIDSPELHYTYSDKENNVYIYYLGKVERVPISYGSTQYHDGIGTITLSYSNEYMSEESVSVSKEECINYTSFVQTENSIEVEVSAGVNTTVGIESLLEVSTDFNVKTTNGLKNTVENTKTKSYADLYATTNTFVEKHSETISRAIDNNYDAGFYRYTLFADCDVYAFVVYDSVDNDVTVSFDLSANDSTLYYDLDRSEKNTFGATESYEDKLTFDTSVIEDDGIFDYKWQYKINYELNGGSFSSSANETYNLEEINLSIPQKQHFAFGGWYTDAEFITPVNEDELLQNPTDITLYACWCAIEEGCSYSAQEIVTPMKNDEEQRFCYLDLDESKLATYANEGYKIRLKATYTAGVKWYADPIGSDPSDIYIRFGLTTDGSFVEKTNHSYANMSCDTSVSDTLVFESDISDIIGSRITLCLGVYNNDVIFLAGQDTGWFDNLSISVEYYK